MEIILMSFADSLAERVECETKRVGAILTDGSFTRIYSMGYNGGPRGQDWSCQLDGSACGCAHAEENALAKCCVDDPMKVLFVTVYPCARCATLLINSGISLIYYRHDHDKMEKPALMFEKEGVLTYKLTKEKE